MTGLQPGYTYFFRTGCLDVCCGNLSTIGDTSNLTVMQLNSTSVYLNWTGQLPLANQTFTLRPAQVENITEVSFSNSSLTINWMVPPGHVDSYIVTIFSAELNMSLNQTTSANITEISNLTAGRVYNITVTSVTGILKNISSVVSFATKPNPPEALIVNDRTNSSISLLWSKPLLMDGVDVFYEVSYTPSQSGSNQTTSQDALTLTSLTSGSRYEICVVTIGLKDRRSSYVNLTTYTAPNPVQNLNVSAVGTSSVNLTWLPPNGNSSLFSYTIHITTLNQTKSTASNNYQITQLQPGTQYNCSVKTHIMNGNISGPSETIQCNTKPLPVVNLTASRIGTTEMQLSWSHQSDYKSTYLYSVSVNGEQRTQSMNETVKVPNLTAGSNYTFAVQTVAYGISSEPVSISEFTGLDKASVISAVGTTETMRVEWKPPNGTVSLYSVKLLLNGMFFKMENRTNETSVVFSGLLPGTVYNVVVSSISGPNKQDSDSVQNATFPIPPHELKVMAQSSDSLNISWARPLNMSSVPYSFLLQYSSTNQSGSFNCSQNFTSLTVLSAGVLYNISVKTVGALGYMSTPNYLGAYTNPSPVTGVKVTKFTESSIALMWEQHDDQQYGYSYLLNIMHPNGTNELKTVNNTTAELLSLQSASQYNISIITKTRGPTQSDPKFITAYSKPYPVSNVSYELYVSAVRLRWDRPYEYHSGISYRILVSNCTQNNKNLSTSSENITVTDLLPGTLCLFSLYSLANGILGEPQNITNFTKPSVSVPKVENQGANDSLVVTWDRPVGGLDVYILKISSMEFNNSIKLNNTQQNHTFSQLKAATVFKITLTSVKGNLQETSSAVYNATYPNKPGELKEVSKSTHSLQLQWAEAQGMTTGSFNYSLTYWLGLNSRWFLTTNNTFRLDNLRSGTSYNVSVATVGPMGFESESVFRYPLTTMPDPVQNLKVISMKTSAISVTWMKVERVPKYVVRVYEKAELNNYTTSLESCTVENLMPSTRYNISVRSSTSDDTEGDDVWLDACTVAAPVQNVNCIGPNLTLPMLILSWSPPPGGYLVFEVKLSSHDSLETTNSFNHSFTGLKYKTSYNATLWTIGCGNKSIEKEITCMTGITRPVVPTIETAAKVSDTQYNKFTVILQPEVFNDSNGPVLYYGVLVCSDTTGCKTNSESNQWLLNTYERWKANLCSTYLAVVVKAKEDEPTIVIGDQTQWEDYRNGELYAKGSYRFAIITFTHLKITNNLVDVSNSYYSISQFYQSSIILPENPVVIGGLAGGVGVIAVLLVIIIGVVACSRKQRKDDSSSVPIHSIRSKVSNPIKVENYEAYYRRQRADSFCGFAEEFEDLRPVGMSQAKAVATAPENKTKNRYNNVLPYDSCRVKLSVLGSPFDDYINASYMPGYTTKKEFIAAQGPLPCTVNDFWRMIWEKNVHTIVMLTKCNEQGRVKCEEYWPADVKSFNNLTVTTISEIPLEDWTIRDFEVRNVKTSETRSVRHFHFTAWPDHGVPETTELLINFRHLVREHMEQYSRHSPTLVHCSAGVGRTGTLIAIDRLIFQIERDGIVDVYGIIHDLRMHRPLMVQTEDQYVFLNQCAMDFIRSRTGNNLDLIYQNTAALNIYENFEPLKKSKNGYHNA